MEWKNVDVGIAITNPAGSNIAWQVGTFLNPIAPGNTPTTRVGRKVAINSLLIRWIRTGLLLASTGPPIIFADGGPPFRVIIVYDKQPFGAIPAITEILISADYNSPLNLNNSERFLILHDEQPCIKQGHNSSNMSGKIYLKWPKALTNQWGGAGSGNIADCSSGAIYCFFGTPNNTTAQNFSFTGYSRIRYTDA